MQVWHRFKLYYKVYTNKESRQQTALLSIVEYFCFDEEKGGYNLRNDEEL